MGSGSVPVLPSQGVNLLPSLGGAAMAADETRENGADLMDGHDGLNEPGASSNVCVILLLSRSGTRSHTYAWSDVIAKHIKSISIISDMSNL